MITTEEIPVQDDDVLVIAVNGKQLPEPLRFRKGERIVLHVERPEYGRRFLWCFPKNEAKP